jgi:hypothetical protein
MLFSKIKFEIDINNDELLRKHVRTNLTREEKTMMRERGQDIINLEYSKQSMNYI